MQIKFINKNKKKKYKLNEADRHRISVNGHVAKSSYVYNYIYLTFVISSGDTFYQLYSTGEKNSHRIYINSSKVQNRIMYL